MKKLIVTIIIQLIIQYILILPYIVQFRIWFVYGAHMMHMIPVFHIIWFVFHLGFRIMNQIPIASRPWMYLKLFESIWETNLLFRIRLVYLLCNLATFRPICYVDVVLCCVMLCYVALCCPISVISFEVKFGLWIKRFCPVVYIFVTGIICEMLY